MPTAVPARPKSVTNSTNVLLNYQLLRNTTSPDEVLSEIRSFTVNLSAFEILKLGTKENLRSYLAEDNPKKRNRIHDAIRNTIENDPERFITRNSGFVISASDIEVDDQKKTVRLCNASVINGAQSQGEIRRWVLDTFGDDFRSAEGEPPFYVRAEIIVDADEDEVIETAIARNTATPVKSISQLGARGELDDLQASISARFPDLKIRKKETEENAYDTRKLLQFTRLLMPESVSKNSSASEMLRAYKNPEQCLREFSEWFDKKNENPEARSKYDFTVQIAPYAIEEYEYWERHDAWNGHRLWEETKKGGRVCRRDKYNKIVWVSPGLIFPILGAMAEFVMTNKAGKWVVQKPAHFKSADMVAQAMRQFRSVKSDPMQMGRSAGAYEALRIYPQTITQVMRDLAGAEK